MSVDVSVSMRFQEVHDVDRGYDDYRMLIFLDLPVRLVVDETCRHQDSELPMSKPPAIWRRPTPRQMETMAAGWDARMAPKHTGIA
ncbi:hypothetical protein [Bradyrhizobium diazoefficiens]